VAKIARYGDHVICAASRNFARVVAPRAPLRFLHATKPADARFQTRASAIPLRINSFLSTDDGFVPSPESRRTR
jgi:hypothetical protein